VHADLTFAAHNITSSLSTQVVVLLISLLPIRCLPTMKLVGSALAVLISLSSTYAKPIPRSSLSKRLSVGSLDDVLLLDAPAFQDPSDSSKTIASMEAFVFLHQLPLNFSGILEDAVNAIGLDKGGDITTAADRLKLFSAVGIPGTHATVNVSGCSESPELPSTGLSDLGIVTSDNVPLGSCGVAATKGAATLTATVQNDDFSSAKIFPSGPDGFGVISDIDDTVKISHVLDKLELIQTTLFDDPEPVAGMPDVYASLAKSLNSPQFMYVSGSPVQLYPFLQDFISTTYSASVGPIFLKNFTLLNPAKVLDALIPGADDVLDYKVSQITRIHGMYPNKSFLTVGDSTEKDPETYGQIFNTFGSNFVRCIWIHLVDGANNTDARFNAAFKGVPQEKIRLFNDTEIPSLSSIDVAGGKC